MWPLLFKILSYAAAAFFAFMSIVIVVDLVTLTREDRRLLEHLKLHVSAVERFNESVGRLPEHEELAQIWRDLPKSGPGYFYHLSTSEVPRPRRGGPVSWPTSGGWAVWMWLGESSEYYTSWNRHYSLAQPMSWFGIEGWFLLSPLMAAVCFFMPLFLSGRKSRTSR